MAKNTTKETTNELERLRDILYGEHARSMEDRVTDLEDRLAQFSQDISKRLESASGGQAKELQDARMALGQRLDQVEASLADQRESDWNKLGSLLVELGHQLQNGQLKNDG